MKGDKASETDTVGSNYFSGEVLPLCGSEIRIMQQVLDSQALQNKGIREDIGHFCTIYLRKSESREKYLSGGHTVYF